MPTVEPLAADRLEDVIAVLSDAFHAYPVMRHVVGPDGDVDARVERLIRFFVTRRVRRGGPMIGVVHDEALAGAAILTMPDEPTHPLPLSTLEYSIWRELGDGARQRYDDYARCTKAFATDERHHHLNMIGVRRAHAGRGFARPLLEAVRQMAAGDAGSAGVSLTTETANNVPLYEHFGYRVVGHAHVAPDLETWGMFLPTR